jgi:hypothetical protein
MAGINDVITTPSLSEILFISGSVREKHGSVALDPIGNLVINSYSGSNTQFLSGSVGIGTDVNK